LQSKINESDVNNSSRIAPDFLLKRNRGDLVLSALASGFIIFVSSIFLRPEQYRIVEMWLELLATVIVFVGLLRNRIVEWIYKKISFVTYCRLEHYSNLLFATSLLLIIGGIVLPPQRVEYAVTGPMITAGFVTMGILSVIGRTVSDRAEASLFFSQCISEMNLKNNVFQSFLWLDRGLYALLTILKQYGVKAHMPNLRLGARLSLLEVEESKNMIDGIAQAILNIEDANQFRKLISEVKTLEFNATQAKARGILPQPRLTDYFDYRYLTLENIRIIISIAILLVTIAISCITGRISPPLPTA